MSIATNMESRIYFKVVPSWEQTDTTQKLSPNIVPVGRIVRDLQDDDRQVNSKLPISEEYLSLNRDELCLFARNDNVFVAQLNISERKLFLADGKNESFQPSLTEYLKSRWSLEAIEIKPIFYPRKTKIGYCGSAARHIGLTFMRYHKLGIKEFKHIVKPSPSIMSLLEKQYHKVPEDHYYENTTPSGYSTIRFSSRSLRCPHCCKRKLFHFLMNHVKQCALKKARSGWLNHLKLGESSPIIELN